MSAVHLAWRLARAGGRFRPAALIGGNAIGALLFLLALAVPAAIREPGAAADGEEALVARSVVVFLCLPVTLLLLSIGRLSASTRDRRLASLRMLGLTPARTRLVAAVENALLAVVGVGIGLAGYLVAAPRVSAWVTAGPGWFRQPLQLSWPSVIATCAGLVLLSALVSLAPSRSLQRGYLQVRREGASARPSVWRVVVLGLGVATLVTALQLPVQSGDISEDAYSLIVLTGVVLTGLGIAVALPVVVHALAAALARWPRGVALRLAANRLACEPASTVRVVSGTAVAAFLVTASVGVIAAFASTPEYVAARHAYEEGPQRHELDRRLHADAPAAPALTGRQIRRIEGTPGVQAVVPQYPVQVACPPDPAFCGRVFVGTCAHLNLRWVVVPGCRDSEISLIGSGRAPGPVELFNQDAPERTVTVTPGPRVLAIDGEASKRRFPDYDPVSLFVPADSPQVAAILGEPSFYWVLTGPGEAPREAVAAAVADLPHTLRLQHLDGYWNTQRLQVLLWTMAVVVIGIGLLSTLLTALDRAIERRRQIASQLVLGVRLRLLRTSQLLQTLIPLWLALVAAIGLGFLPLVAILRVVPTAGAAPLATLSTMAAAALAAAVIVAAATLPGIGGRLTPDLLRRE